MPGETSLPPASAAEHNPPIRFRRATPTDAATIAALGATIWITTYCDQGVTADFAEYVLSEFTITKLARTLAATDTVFWLAEADAGPVAFAELRLGAHNEHLADQRQAEVARLYVLDRFSRRGIGRALLEHCRTNAAEYETTALWLTMYAGNEPARSFYRALGWQKVGDMHFVLNGKSYPNDVLTLALTGHSA